MVQALRLGCAQPDGSSCDQIERNHGWVALLAARRLLAADWCSSVFVGANASIAGAAQGHIHTVAPLPGGAAGSN